MESGNSVPARNSKSHRLGMDARRKTCWSTLPPIATNCQELTNCGCKMEVMETVLWPHLYSTMQLHMPGLMEAIIITIINVVVVKQLLRRSIDANPPPPPPPRNSFCMVRNIKKDRLGPGLYA